MAKDLQGGENTAFLHEVANRRLIFFVCVFVLGCVLSLLKNCSSSFELEAGSRSEMECLRQEINTGACEEKPAAG